MTSRRDLLSIRAVLQSATDHDRLADAPARRFGGGPPLSLASQAPHGRPANARPATPADIGSSDVILVKTGLKQVAIRPSEITFVEAARNYVRIHLDGGATLKTRIPIERLASHLGADRFFRVHRGRIANLDRIRGVTVLSGGRVSLTLTNGATVIVARDRRRVVLAELGRRASPTTPR